MPFFYGIYQRHSLIPDEPLCESARRNLHRLIFPHTLLITSLLFDTILALISSRDIHLWLVILVACELVGASLLALLYVYGARLSYCRPVVRNRPCTFCFEICSGAHARPSTASDHDDGGTLATESNVPTGDVSQSHFYAPVPRFFSI